MGCVRHAWGWCVRFPCQVVARITSGPYRSRLYPVGPIIEPSLIQALYIADATSIGRLFFTGVINITLIAVSALSIAFLVWTWRRDRVLVGIVCALFSVNNNFGLLAEYEYIDNNLGGLVIHSASLGLRMTF